MYTGEILQDISRTGRERPWKLHKSNSLLLSESYYRIGKKRCSEVFLSKSERVRECGSSLKFNVCPEGHEKRLSWANFCRVRLCPMCGWRKSLLNAHQVKEVCHQAVLRWQEKNGSKLRWLFLTLTVRNMKGEDLPKAITHLRESWHRLIKRSEFKIVVGWFRATEVTRNMIEDTYHPHYHVLLAVPPSYFDTGYIRHDEWVRIWQDCLQVDYEPNVDIRIVKNKRNIEREQKILAEKGIEMKSDGRLEEADLSGSAVAELAKYTTKSDDFLVYNRYKQKQKKDKVKLVPDYKKGIDEEKTDDVVFTLDNALARRRLFAYGGLLKEIWNELAARGELQDIEDDKADLIHVDEDKPSCPCSVCGSNMLEELYSWLPDARNYVKKEKNLSQ